MAQTLLYPHVATSPRDKTEINIPLARLAALAPVVFLIHGYHPYSDDASIYVPGIQKLLNPSLYKLDAPFVVSNTHLSIFAHLLAAVVVVTHVPLPIMLLVTHLVSIFLFLIGCWCLASCIFRAMPERWFAVAFAGACFTLPAAGTALVLMDPYVTARSFSTPLGLCAIAAAIDRRWGIAAALIVLTGLVHPLMALYALAMVAVYVAMDVGGVRAAALVGVMGVVVAALVYFATRFAPVSAAYREAMMSKGRMYFFLTQWKWYEDLGLVMPLLLLAIALYRSDAGGRARKLCAACLVLGISSIVVSLLFVHPEGPYLLVRIQVLRGFHVIYAVGIVLLGGWLGGMLWRQRRTRWMLFVLLAAAGGGLFAAQRTAYPNSAHIEWPGMKPRNQWVQAYVWIRNNTPQGAVFAADPNLEFNDGADMQGFRATTERSLLANNKDQGVAAGVNPAIAGIWAKQRDAQIGIDTMSDAEREAKLKPLGVTWLLLRADAKTSFACPFENAVAKVCELE
jgi:Domain of unknown function (DUF6798)